MIVSDSLHQQNSFVFQDTLDKYPSIGSSLPDKNSKLDNFQPSNYTINEEQLIRADERERVAVRLQQEMKVLDKDQQEMIQLAIDSINEMEAPCELGLGDVTEEAWGKCRGLISTSNGIPEISLSAVLQPLIPEYQEIRKANGVAEMPLLAEVSRGGIKVDKFYPDHSDVWRIVKKGIFVKRYYLKFIASIHQSRYSCFENVFDTESYVRLANKYHDTRYSVPYSEIKKREKIEVDQYGISKDAE